MGVKSYATAAPPQSIQERVLKFRDRLVHTSKQSMLEIREKIEEESEKKKLSLVDIVRHGFIFGAVVGLIAEI